VIRLHPHADVAAEVRYALLVGPGEGSAASNYRLPDRGGATGSGSGAYCVRLWSGDAVGVGNGNAYGIPHRLGCGPGWGCGVTRYGCANEDGSGQGYEVPE
jgi:hypothetical protein